MIIIVIITIFIWGCSTQSNSTFDKNKILAAAEEQAVPALEKDYDTETVQIRHLSWGKLNYFPEAITVKAGKKVQLVGDMTRLQGCFRSFTIPDLNVNGNFNEQNNIIEFTPAQPGTFGFGCSMGMGNGRLIVQ